MATNVLIAFYSRSGVTEALAKAIAEGAKAEGAEVRQRGSQHRAELLRIVRRPGHIDYIAEQLSGMRLSERLDNDVSERLTSALEPEDIV